MEGKGSFLILLVIVAFLSLTLAVLAGYVFFVGGSHATSEAVQKNTTRPDDKDLGSKVIFDKENFNLKNVDANKISMIQVGIEIKYNLKIKYSDKTTADDKLTAYEGDIEEIIGKYFRNMTLDDAAKPETMDKAKEDLKNAFNDVLTANEKDKSPIVFDVIFNKWLYQ